MFTLPIDLHVHSTHSDGLLPPEKVVELAFRHGVKALALADHDAVSGIDEAIEAGKAHGIEVLPAVELSVAYRGWRDVHLLGYCLDHRDQAFREKLEAFRAAREGRAEAIVGRINRKLAEEGKGSVSFPEIALKAEGAIGRPHIARALIEGGMATDLDDAFTRYLVPCDVPKQYFAIEEAVGEIRRLNGVAVLAHPQSMTRDRKILRHMLEELKEIGVDGIEAVNTMGLGDESAFLTRAAADAGMLVTGGSDFHGNEESSTRPSLTVPEEILHSLKETARLRREAAAQK